MEVHYIYKIANKFNDKVYIGRTNNTITRWTRHKQEYKNMFGKHPALHSAMKKYDINNFTFEIINSYNCTLDEIILVEEEYISKYNSYKNGYNSINTGIGGPIMRGEDNPLSKLSNNEADEIFELLLKSNMPQVEIAKQYDVATTTISAINTGRLRYNTKIQYPIRKNSKRVIQLTLDKEYIATHNSMRQAATAVNGQAINISKAVRGILNKHKKFKWVLEKDYIEG